MNRPEESPELPANAAVSGADLAALVAGDQEAWRRAWPELQGVARGAIGDLIGSPDDRDDVVAIALGKLPRLAARCHDWHHLRCLVAVVAEYSAKHWNRARHAAIRDIKLTDSLDAEPREFTADDVWRRVDALLDLEVLIATLPPLRRELLHAHLVRGVSSAQLAVEKQLTADTVRWHIMKGMHHLRRQRTS